MPFAENLGTAGAALNAQYGSTSAPNSNAPLLLDPRPSGPFVYLPAESGNFVSFPHSLPLSMTGDVDLRAYVAADDWSPSADQTIVGKWNVAGSYSYRLVLAATGVLRFDWSADGTAVLSATSTAPVGFADGVFGWVRVSFDANNGASGRTVTFATSTDGTAWTTLGTPVTQAGTTSMFVSSAQVEVGSSGTGTAALLSGRVQVAQVAADLAGSDVRLFVDFSDELTTGAESLVPDSSSTIIPAGTQSYPNLGWGGGVLNAYAGSSAGADSNDPLFLAHTGTNYLYLPGAASNSVSIPSNANLNTADFDASLIVRTSFTLGAQQTLFNRYNGTTDRWWYLASTNLFVLLEGSTTITSSAAITGVENALRVSFIRDTGAGQYECKFYTSTDSGATWVQLGATRTGASPTTHTGTSAMFVGSYVNGTLPLTASVSRFIYKDGPAGVTVVDIDTSAITSGAATSFTATTGQTVTINRSTSGRKAVAVVRPVWLFGTDDYLQVADNDLLDFGATDSFTVMAAVRRTGTLQNFNTILAKRDNVSSGSTVPGYGWRANADGRFYFWAGGSSTPRVASSPAATVNTLSVVTSVHSPSSTTTYLGETAGTAVTTPAAADMSNSRSLFIGRGAVTTEYADMELFAVAIWRRALSAAEIAAVSDHLDSTPSAAGAELLTDAVFYIDARQRAVGQINRAQTGRKAVACVDCVWLLGTDDYFEIPSESSFNLTGTEDGTWLIRARRFRTPGTVAGLFTKASAATAGADGWAITTGATDSDSTRVWFGDGSTDTTDSVAGDWSALETFVVVRDSGTMTVWRDTTQGTAVADTTGDLSNTSPTRIGALNGGSYFDGEIEAAAFWRRALTAPEIAAVLSYYGV